MASTTPHSTYCNYQTVSDETLNGAFLWGEETFFPQFHQMNINGVSVDYSDTVVPMVPLSSYPERLGISSDMAVPALPDFNSTFGGFHDGVDQSFGDCCDFDHYEPLYRAARDNWGLQVKQAIPVIEDSTTRVGRYTVEERKDRILRYLKKRNQRNFNKTIKYACRKTLADRRVRVRGRFARNNDPSCEDEMGMKKVENPDQQQKEQLFFGDDGVQIKQDEDEWLQQAIASLVYLPYIGG